MSRHFGLLAALLAAPVFAQELLPPSPVDLVRGLREGGMADLGLEYLADLAKVASPEVAKVLPLERAKCRLDMARTESDDTLRAALVSEAKREFDAFVKGNSGHPRLPEAAVALAQLQTLEGKGQLQRAARLPTEQQAGEMAKARPLFESAGKQYAAAAEVLKKLADQEEPNSAKGREYATNYLQALLDQGMNTFFLAESYGEEPRGKDTDSKVKAAKDAAFVFDALWSRSKDTPQGWAARAWSAESFREQFEPNKADAALKVVVDEAAKARTPASAAGAKVARFFQLRADYVKNGHAQAASADRLRVRSTCQGWLREFATPPTAEVYAVRYYLGRVCLNEGLKRENLNVEQVKPKDPKEKPEEKVVGVKDSGVQMLREADAQFKILVRTENEYTDRATRQRPLALRWLVGNPNRPPAQFPTFDDCYTAALVQLENAREAASPPERLAALDKAIALLERAGRLPVPAESSRDAARAALDLARVYSAAGRPLAAAVYAEHLARTARSPSAAAKAAAVALDAYSRASRSTPSDDLRAVDRERRISLATHIDRIAPNEPDADGVRVQLAADLYRAGRKLEAFEAFARVPARFPRLAQARMFEGIAAFDLIRPLSADETRTEGLTAERKQTIYQKAVADLAAVPIPVDAVKDDPEGDAPVSDYFNLRLQLAQLHLTQGAKGYTPAEEVVVSSAEVAQKHPGLAADEKARFAMRFELMHIRAVYAQAMPLYQQGKFAEAAERFGKLLDPVLAAGPAAKKHSAPELIDLAKSLDADRVRLLLVPALNARVREGAAAKTSELLDKLKEFGGDLSTSARVVQQGVGSIRPAVDALRKEKKDADADKLIDAVTGMVAKLAGEKDLPNDVRVNLGKSFRELGQYARAAELLTIVPPPSNMEAFKSEQKASENETAEQAAAREKDAAAVPLYRAARVELARAYRLDKKFTEAAAVLDEALGKEAEQKNATGVKPRAGGWASRFPEYRKESILLLEAKATADPKGGALLWNEAIANWRGWSAEYVQALNTLNRTYYPAKRDSERLTTRARLLDALANKEKVDFDDEKKQAAKELEQAVKDAAAADEGVAAATKAVDAANNPADAEKAREALDTARDMADDAARKVGELKARLPLLEEFAKLKDPDWADEAKKAQQAVEPLQRQMGEMERKINPLRSILQDVSAEQMRCVAAAQAAITRQSNPTNYAAYLTRQGKEIAEFEKKNRPLPVNVKQKLYDLLESNKELKDEYRKAGGIDFLTPPSGQ